jgi:carbamoyl-phosphate synthase large subunit
VIGAGRGQINLMEICQKRNFEVIAISREGNYPGFDVAERSYKIDVRDKEKVLQAAKEEKIVGIMTDQLDAGVPTVAYVAEKMGLPGIGYDCSLKFTNKYLMKQEAQKLGVDIPELSIALTLEEACREAERIGFPVVIKPIDQEGSRGVVKVNNRAELEENFASTLGSTLTGYILIEKFISGIEYIPLGFVQNYKYTNLIISQYYPFDVPNFFIPKMKIAKDTKFVSNAVEEKIIQTTDKLVQGFGMRLGVVQAEYLYNEVENKLYLVEIAARGGGMFTSSDLVPLACGINVNELLVDLATGKTKEIDLAKLRTGVAGYLCFALPECTITAIENADKLLDIPGIYRVYLDTIHVGKTIGKMKDKSMRFGPIIFYGETESDCMQSLARVKETLKIRGKTVDGEEIEGILW